MPYPFTAIKGERFSMPKELLGPTGMVFFHPKGVSTHLNIVTGDVVKGQHAIVPLLVPGQMFVDRLLAGEPATETQLKIATSFARKQADGGAMPPAFPTVDEALTYEKQWHDQAAVLGQQYLPAGAEPRDEAR